MPPKTSAGLEPGWDTLTNVRWRKASYCGDGGSSCVEITTTKNTSVAPHKSGEDVLYLMRDSKDPDGPVLAFTAAEWDAFVLGVKDGEFDLAEDDPAG